MLKIRENIEKNRKKGKKNEKKIKYNYTILVCDP